MKTYCTAQVQPHRDGSYWYTVRLENRHGVWTSGAARLEATTDEDAAAEVTRKMSVFCAALNGQEA